MQEGIDYVGVSVVYICHDKDGNIIFSKRGQNSKDEQGTWDTGGGRVEFKDTVLQTLKKEIAEEYCTDILEYEFLGYRDLHREHEGKKTHWIAIDFKVLVDREKVKNGEPHKFDEIGWFTLDNLPTPLHSQIMTQISLYKDKLKF